MPRIISVFGVQPLRIGGTETFARELSRQLAESGWQSVLCFQTEPPESVKDFLRAPNVHLEAEESLTTSNFQSLGDLRRLLQLYRPDILHLHFTGFLGLFPWLARLMAVKQIFFTDHSSRPVGHIASPAARWKRGLTRLINAPLTKVICVSQYGYDCMTTLDVLHRSRYELVYNGVDLSRVIPDPELGARFRRRYSIPDGSPVVTQISWIIPEKGIPELLETARLVVTQEPRVRFIIVGEGPYRQQYMQRAEAMGLSEQVIWTGLIEDPFAAGVFDAADVVCQLSRWEEVFGWMIAEAMAYGKPVVATRVGGIPELIDDGITGFLVDRGDSNTAAKRVLKLIEDKELRESVGQNGRDKTHAKFNLKTNVAQLIQLYRNEGRPHGSQNIRGSEK